MTTSTTILQTLPTTPFSTSAILTCPACGEDFAHTHQDVAQDAQQRISELEAQVKLLTSKATAAADKLADYEDELRQLKSQSIPASTYHSSPSDPNIHISSSTAVLAARPSTAVPNVTPATPQTTSTRRPSNNPLQNRLSALLLSRRSASQPPASAPASQILHATAAETSELLSALAREQTLRQAAESQVNQTNDELEELSAQLFQQANEMVATERKARAKLEERVMMLERRDGEKRKRLEVLEGRLSRIEKVRALLSGKDDAI